MSAVHSQARGGRFAGSPAGRPPKSRKKLAPALQWLLSFVLMVFIFAIYFDLCLLFAKYGLDYLSKKLEVLLLIVLLLLTAGLTTVLVLFGDWKRPLIMLLICMMLYAPFNFSNLTFFKSMRETLIQTAYDTMQNQGLMYGILPWVAEREAAEYQRQKEALDSLVTTVKFVSGDATQPGEIKENANEEFIEKPEENPEIIQEIIQQDPGFQDLPQDQKHFYALFYELDRASTEAYLAQNPAALKNGYEHILINHSAIGDGGTSIRTKLGEKVLAIDADNRILIVEIDAYDAKALGGIGTHSRAVLAIAKDASKLHLFPAATLPNMGQTAGVIASNHGGILAMTGSGFIDEGGVGLGGELAGFARCNGKDYTGIRYKTGYKRMELHENNWFYMSRATDPVGAGTTDCMEFQPALVVDGQKTPVGYWYGSQPRACIGQSRRGEILMLCVEGRRTDSPGCSVEVCADIFVRHDGLTAMNCDGGTTAILWYRGNPLIRCSNPAIPQGRYLPNAWVIVKN